MYETNAEVRLITLYQFNNTNCWLYLFQSLIFFIIRCACVRTCGCVRVYASPYSHNTISKLICSDCQTDE